MASEKLSPQKLKPESTTGRLLSPSLQSQNDGSSSNKKSTAELSNTSSSDSSSSDQESTKSTATASKSVPETVVTITGVNEESKLELGSQKKLGEDAIQSKKDLQRQLNPQQKQPIPQQLLSPQQGQITNQLKLLNAEPDLFHRGTKASEVDTFEDSNTVDANEYCKNSSLKHRCPWCGQVFTSAIRRQIHLMLYPRKKKSCNFTSEELVSCFICQESIVGKYFDIHGCIFTLVQGLEGISITDDPFKSEASDYCFLCNIYNGCRYTLLSHLIVMHFPYADESQCGYCGKKSSELIKHVKLHRADILFFSTNKIIELMQYTLGSQGKKKHSVPGILGCCVPEIIDEIKPSDILIYFFQPNSCLLCTNFIGGIKSLNSHILWDWHECNHKALRNINEQLFLQEGVFQCRFCLDNHSSMIGHVCPKYHELVTGNTQKVPKTASSVMKSCLLCWNRNCSPVQLLAHIPVFHNFGAVSRCGICHERINPHHNRIHEETLYTKAQKLVIPSEEDI